MNAVWNSYGQLCGCPEIFKKSCKFFCRELDIRVTKIMYPDSFYPAFLAATIHLVGKIIFRDRENSVIWLQAVILFEKVLHLVT